MNRITVAHSMPLDSLLFLHYKRHIKGVLESVVEINRGLSLFEYVPVGYIIELPDEINERPNEVVKLWD